MSIILLAVVEEPAWRLRDEEDDWDLDARSHSDPALKIPPVRHLVHHRGCSNLAQAVGDEEGDGDEAVVGDPGEGPEAPLEPNRLHQIDLQAGMEAKGLDQQGVWRLPR